MSQNRFASISVPVGVRWAVMNRVEDLYEEDGSACAAAWAKEQAGGQGWNGRC
jgi:hypothetical protein